MSNRTKIILTLVALTIILLGVIRYRRYSVDKNKRSVISQLEMYKTSHLTYPLDIKELNIDIQTDFYYYPDSTRQFFNLA